MRLTAFFSLRAVLAAVVLTAALLAPAAAATEPKVYGIELVPYSKKIDDDRYRSSRDWSGTMRYFRKKFAGWKHIRWHSVVNLPAVKYIFIENTYPRRQFDGINVYELPGGEVRMYILQHQKPKKDEAKTDQPAKRQQADG